MSDVDVIVWAVVYSNYDPYEIDSLWTSEAEAEKRCEEANEESDRQVSNSGNWEVKRMTAHGRWEPSQG